MDSRMYKLYDMLVAEGITYCADLCKQIILTETVVKTKKKLNLYDYVGSDNSRPAITGCYHNNGDVVATDCNILVVDRSIKYQEDFEGKIIDKKGAIVEGCKYPNYLSVRPAWRDSEEATKRQQPRKEVTVDLEQFAKEIAKGEIEYNGLYGRDKKYNKLTVEVVPEFKVPFRNAKKLLKLLKAKPDSKTIIGGYIRNGMYGQMYLEFAEGWAICMGSLV